MELLAPAGDYASFIGAINAGANAVYLAGKKFGARASASNFTQEELVTMIQYAHLRDVRLFVTVNTLLFEDEFSQLLEYTDFLVHHHVDALIVQDFGLIDTLTKRYPDTDIHVSTQANTHSIEMVQWLKSLGVKRIVLARETDLEFVKEIKSKVDMEVEVFIHGALCVSYSGNCLHSSMIGKRSGNRGECAQSCRLPYKLYRDQTQVGESGYLLSTKDLMTLDRLDEIMDSGVDSLKIEGRMRKPEYVIGVTKAYHEAIQQRGVLFNQTIEDLKRLFHREFTGGYLLGTNPSTLNQPYRPNHIGVKIGEVISYHRGKAGVILSESLRVQDGVRFLSKNDYGMVVSRILVNDISVISAKRGDKIILDVAEEVRVGDPLMKTQDKDLEESYQPYLSETYPLIPIHMKVQAWINQPLTIRIHHPHQEIELRTEYRIPKAINQPTSREQIQSQLSKLGQTPFALESIEVETDESGFIPVGVLNQARRDALETLKNHLLQRPESRILSLDVITPKTRNVHPQLVVKVETMDQFNQAHEQGIQTIYYDEELAIDEPSYPGLDLYVARKRIYASQVHSLHPKKVVVHEISSVIHNPKISWIADQFFNVTNTKTIDLLERFGAKRIVLSSEVNKSRLTKLVQQYRLSYGINPPLEMIVYGRLDLMISKYCPITTHVGNQKDHCQICHHNQYYLEDRIGMRFPLKDDGNCNIRLLHAKPLFLLDEIPALLQLGVSTIRLDFTIESKAETKQIIEQAQAAFFNRNIPFDESNYTRGRFYR